MSKLLVTNKANIIKDRPLNAKKTGCFRIGQKDYVFQYDRVNGEIQQFEFDHPIGEMITSERQEYFIKRVYLDIDLAREREPLLYLSIYDVMTDSNFPETFLATWLQEGRVVFLQHIEGSEVKFGTREAREGDTAQIITWAAGFEYTEDMILYNRTWDMTMFNMAFGEAHNALKNHVHFSPILNFAYAAANQTALSTAYDAPAFADWAPIHRNIMNLRQTLIDAVRKTRLPNVDNTPNRPGSKLLIHSSNEQLVKDAIGQRVLEGQVYQAISGIDEIISYDGWTTVVGGKTYTYAGCPTDKAYLIMPKKYMKSLIKHDLRIDSDNADLSRLIEKQLVGRSRMGVYAGVERSVEEISLDFPA